MESVGVILVIIAMVLLVILLIRAIKLVKNKEKQVDKTTAIIGAVALSIFIVGMILIPSENGAGYSESDEEKITKVVIKTIGKTSNTKQERVETVKYFNDSEDVLINLTLNASENLTNKLTRGGILRDSTNLLEALFKNGYDEDVNIMWKLPLTDSYGNKEGGKVLSFTAKKEEVAKINFSNFDYNNLPNIVESYNEHPEFNK